MPEYLRIKINKDDLLAKEWSGSAGVNEIIIDPTEISGDVNGVDIQGYILAETDHFGNVSFRTDLPEPVKIQGDSTLTDRVHSFEAEDFDDLEAKLRSEFDVHEARSFETGLNNPSQANIVDENEPLREYLRIKVDQNDYFEKEWSGSAGVNEIIVDPTTIGNNGNDVEISGYVLAETDDFGNVFFHTDVPEPFKLKGDGDLQDRIYSFEARGFDDLENKLNKEMEENARNLAQEILEEVNAEYDQNVKGFAREYMLSGARDLDEYHGRGKEADFGLSLDTQNQIIFDINQYDALSRTNYNVRQEIDRRLRGNDRYVDRDVSMLEDERRGIVYEMNELDEKYNITEVRKGHVATTQHHSSQEESINPPNLPNVSEDEFNQAKSDFGLITEDNLDDFMDELALLQDEGLSDGLSR